MAISGRDVKAIEFLKSDKRIFIPIYQRSYDWTTKEIEKLVDDVMQYFDEDTLLDRTTEYYLGNIVVKEGFDNVISPEVIEYNKIVDGQQRLTSLSLIFRAMYERLEKSELGGKKVILNVIKNVLFVDFDNEDIPLTERIKLTNQKNADVFKGIAIQGTKFNPKEDEKFSMGIDPKTTNYYKNYKFIVDKFDDMKDEDILSLYRALKKVKLVVIQLDENQNENSVFESINSTGKKLTLSDLAKNYIFSLGTGNIREITKAEDYYLQNIEYKYYFFDKPNEQLSDMFRMYVSLKLNIKKHKAKNAVSDNLFDFKTVCKKYNLQLELLRDIKKFSDVYIYIWKNKIGLKDTDAKNGIKYDYLSEKSSLEMYQIVLLKAGYFNYDNEVSEPILESMQGIYKEVFNIDIIIRLANSEAKQLNRVIQTIVTDFDPKKNNLYDALVENIEGKNITIPSKHLFIARMEIEPVYKNASAKRAALYMYKILEFDVSKKELTKSVSMEHIMPQTIDKTEWVDLISSDNHEMFVHTLGNLIPTAYNSRLANKPFREKSQIIEKNDAYSGINQQIVNSEKWTVEEIKERSKIISERMFNEILNK